MKKVKEYFRISILQLSLWEHKLIDLRENRNMQSIIGSLAFWHCLQLMVLVRIQFRSWNHSRYFKKESNQIKELHKILGRTESVD